jgi:hypothetical protein
VITCLPDVFNDEDKVYEKDSPHFVERIARTMRRDYEQIRSPHDLAAIIVESCTASASVTELGDAAPESETQSLCLFEKLYGSSHVQQNL